VCSFIQSIFAHFGSAVAIDGTGIIMNNRMRGFSLDAASPNLVAPGKRPFHTIIPGFLTRDVGPSDPEWPLVGDLGSGPAGDSGLRSPHGAPLSPSVALPQMSFGVMGGNMQPQGHVQTLVRMLDHRQHPHAACDAPRWRFNSGLDINVESAMPAATVRGLIELGHRVDVIDDSYQDFGAGQFIWRLGDPAVEGYVGASDPRRDGLVAAW
jgi:gamma-glutamyltranspeptidase/glutathione hydrolase